MLVKFAALRDELRAQRFGGFRDLLFARRVHGLLSV
jgi:hypothetical protein